jgi:tRNA/rRNA methyltransferase
MSGVRKSRSEALHGLAPAPAFVLVEPQLGENIGAVARAMLNFGMTDLRIVNPRDGWPNERATATASGADAVIEAVRCFDRLDRAIADRRYVVAATARPRELLAPVFSASEAAAELRARIARGEACAVLFGGERAGLNNDHITRADAIASIPANPAFASLNLAQAALILAYEWGAAAGLGCFASELAKAAPAPKADFEGLMAHLIGALDHVGYFFPPDMRPVMERNLRVSFMRAQLTEQEVRTLRGAVKALAEGPRNRG